LTGGAAECLRVIQLLPDQHHLSNFMSLITSSLNTQTHSPTVLGVKRLERETVYFLSDQRTHVVPIGYQAEWINGNFVNLPIGHEAQKATSLEPEKFCNSVNFYSRQTPNNLGLLRKTLWWQRNNAGSLPRCSWLSIRPSHVVG
jgi:hypothetical protein